MRNEGIKNSCLNWADLSNTKWAGEVLVESSATQTSTPTQNNPTSFHKQSHTRRVPQSGTQALPHKQSPQSATDSPSPFCLFYAIFCLTDFSSDPFDFSSSETGQRGSAHGALSFLRAHQLNSLQVCDSQKLFCWLILMVWRAVLRSLLKGS